jgi:hypothetical protein
LNNIVIDENSLNKLTPEGKALALSILKQYSEKGKSETLENLLLEDYKEIPVGIDDFVDDNNYLGYAWHDGEGKSKVYPFWREQLHKLFPDSFTTSVNNLIESGARGLGKQQFVDSLILTDKGFIRIGDVKVNDLVYGRDGILHKVTAIFPQGIKDCYKVTFTDGSETTSGLEHLWSVENTALKETNFKTHTLKELLDYGLYRKDRPDSPIFKIPLCEPIQFEKQQLPISPYILGVMLGDGCFSNNSFSFVSETPSIVDRVAKELTYTNYRLTETIKANNNAKCYNIVRKHRKSIENGFLTAIEQLGLRGTKSSTKFIPDVYKYSCVDDRIALLQGLMDTDGSAEPNPVRQNDGSSKAGKTLSYKLCYYTTSADLKNDFIWLVQSLGGTAKARIKTNNKQSSLKGRIIRSSPIYVISVKLPSNILPFSNKTKLAKYELTLHREPSRYIKKVTFMGKVECQCILLDSDEHLYITDNFIVTHNSEIAVLAACYLMYRVMCLKSPLEYFNLKPTEKICFAFMNIKLDLAEEIGISKFQKTVMMSPWFLNHGTLEGRNKDTWVPPDYIKIIIGSQASDVIGQPIYFAFFDEISFIRNQDIDKQKAKALDMIDTAIGGMKTRFVHKGKNPSLLVLASSKRSEKSFLEEHMKKKLKSEGDNVIIVDKPVWEVKPKGTYSDKTFNVAVGNKFLNSLVIPDNDDTETYREKGYKILQVPVDFKADFIDDIDRALCDFAGISSSEISKYISGQAVSDTVDDHMVNPFKQEILEIGNAAEDKDQYYDHFDLNRVTDEMRSLPLYVHLDMSISGDMTGIAGVWINGKKASTDALHQANDLYFRLAFAVNIKAPKGRQISFAKNRNFIYWLKEMGFNIKGVSSDTFQAYDTGQELKAHGYNYQIISVDRVDPSSHICVPYQYYRNTIYEKRIVCFPCETLEDELIDLERNINTGKVDHPDGGKKDIADAVCGAVYNASQHAEEYAFNHSESFEQFLDVNEDADSPTKFISQMEEELKGMHHIVSFDNNNNQPFVEKQTLPRQTNSGGHPSGQPPTPTNVDSGGNPYSDMVIF